jgi:hypothetical protein
MACERGRERGARMREMGSAGEMGIVDTCKEKTNDNDKGILNTRFVLY